MMIVNILGCEIIGMVMSFCDVDFLIVGMGFVLVMNEVVLVGVLYSFIVMVYVEKEVEVMILCDIMSVNLNIMVILVWDVIDNVSNILGLIVVVIFYGVVVILLMGFFVLIGVVVVG